MEREVESNRDAWSRLSADHYEIFLAELQAGTHHLNHYIEQELGDLTGKDVIHLQCNTGADTILLAGRARRAVGVDLVPENVRFARKLAADLKVENTAFIESDIMSLQEIHHDKYDVVFTSEGALGWLPDLSVWAKNVRYLLREDGYLY